MERHKAKKSIFRQLKRIGTIAIAATIALSVPAVSNVASKVSPLKNIEVSVAHAQSSNLMNDVRSQFVVTHNDEYEHWTHRLINDADMKVDGPEIDLTDLTYVVKFPDALSHLLNDEYVLDYLFGRVTNFGYTQNPFMITGNVIDENGEETTIARDTHKPYEHISVNTATNSLEFDFTSFYTDNNLEPYIRQNVNGEYIFNNLGFQTSIVVPDTRILDNGTYEFKTAIVRGKSVDLDNVSGTHSKNLVVDYSKDPEPEPEVDTSELEALVDEARGYDSEDYTDDSFAALTEAVEAAESVLGNEEATQAEVDAALADLEAAIEGLVEVEEPTPEPEPEPEVDMSELEALVAEAEGYDSEDYTDDSFAALTEAVEAAEAVLGNEEATQAEVDAVLAELEVAIEGLVEVEEPTPEPEPEPEVDTSELEALVAKADGYNSKDYTEESFAALTKALEATEAVLGNEETTQAEVDTAIAELNAAIDGLVKTEIVEPEPKPEPKPEPEEDKTDTETPTIKEDGSEDDDGKLLPKTATSSFNMMLAGFLVLVIGAGSLFISKRRFN